MLIKIIVDGLYSDFEKQPGFARSRWIEAGTVVDFPGEYGLGLVESELGELVDPSDADVFGGRLPQLVEPSEAVAFEVVEDGEGPKALLTITDTAKKLLDKYKLDPADVTGTGKDGKITHRDANKYVTDFLAAEKEKVKAYLAERETNEA